jgi:hypothetical protein
MNFIFGIYGFHVTQPIVLDGLCSIKPRTSDHRQAEEWAKDSKTYHLTATIETHSIPNDFLFNLEAILSFIENRDVLILDAVKNNTSTELPLFITMNRRKNGLGSVINQDTFFPNIRKMFISKSLEKLMDKEFCEKTQFNILFFKYIESFRQPKMFVDVSYFLLFSGLESYSRSVAQDEKTKNSNNASEPICKLLTQFGFDVSIERPADLRRAISTYTHLRNALFHNSQFKKGVNVNGSNVELKLFDYFANFSILVSLVILKAVDFDDENTNWNSWISMQS